MSLSRGRLSALAMLVLCSSCSHPTADHLQRLAILPPEILMADQSSEWLRAALPLVWEEDLATSPQLVVEIVRDTSGAYQFGATEVLRTTVERRDGQWRFEGTVTNASTQRNRDVFTVAGGSAASILPLANAFAKHVDGHAIDFSTKSDRALQLFTQALQTPNATARMDALDQAVSSDPSFGLAFTMLAQTAARTSPQSLPDLFARAAAHASSFTPLDRAKFNVLAAQAVHAPLSQEETALRTVLQLSPNSLDAIAGIGAIRFLQGDAVNGDRLLSRALELSPGNVNLLEQLGRGLIETRQFAQAEKILAGLDNNPAVLPALATCVLLEGDVRRANSISDRFSQSLQPEAQVIYRATWLALLGNTADAIALLQGKHFTDANVQSAVLAEVVIWHLMDGGVAAAKQAFDSHTAASGGLSAEALLLSRADAPPAEWHQMVESSSPLSAEQKQSLFAYGLFLQKHYEQSAQAWQQAVNRSGRRDLRARAMLAGSLERAGHAQAARKILVEPFVPEFGDLFSAVSFEEMRRLLNLQVH